MLERSVVGGKRQRATGECIDAARRCAALLPPTQPLSLSRSSFNLYGRQARLLAPFWSPVPPAAWAPTPFPPHQTAPTHARRPTLSSSSSTRASSAANGPLRGRRQPASGGAKTDLGADRHRDCRSKQQPRA